MTPELPLFDFREIAAWDDTVTSLRTWIAKSSSFFGDCWHELTGSAAELTLCDTSTESYGKLLEKLSREHYCCLLKINDPATTTMFYMSQVDLRLAVDHVLGIASPQSEIPGSDSPGDEQPDTAEVTEDGTSLSAVELSVAGLILEQLGNCLQEAWMGSKEMVVELSAVEKDPGKKRVFRYSDLVTKTGICVELSQGRIEVGWVLPKQAACDLLDQMADHRELPSSKKPNETTVGKLPIELVAVLGKANMTMASLANLKVGELVLLDQWIDSPIPMLVNEKQHYRCWPGRLGSFQAVEVSDCQDG